MCNVRHVYNFCNVVSLCYVMYVMITFVMLCYFMARHGKVWYSLVVYVCMYVCVYETYVCMYVMYVM